MMVGQMMIRPMMIGPMMIGSVGVNSFAQTSANYSHKFRIDKQTVKPRMNLNEPTR
ncbi:hypothetical protein MNBD_GAMMA08-1616 [hydrothermal vent metagenome]|uniref:Uncharacterized protein n=1 Tax=hydrothermal vent metagenome TaxID=652676 RepID=A0A3B0XK61_9ZZZZ